MRRCLVSKGTITAKQVSRMKGNEVRNAMINTLHEAGKGTIAKMQSLKNGELAGLCFSGKVALSLGQCLVKRQWHSEGRVRTMNTMDQRNTVISRLLGVGKMGLGALQAKSNKELARICIYPPKRWKWKPECPDQCRGQCWLRKFQTVDKDCRPTKYALSVARSMVEYIGTKTTGPKWKVLHTCVSPGQNIPMNSRLDATFRRYGGADWRIKGAKPPFKCFETLTEISCPCSHHNGTRLSKDEAVDLIISGVTTIPDGRRRSGAFGKSLEVRSKEGTPFRGFLSRLKSAVAATNMMSCWRKHCAAEQEVVKEGEVLLEEADGYGGGATC